MKFYRKKSRSQQEHFTINLTLNVEGLAEWKKTKITKDLARWHESEVNEYIAQFLSFQRAISRENLIRDLLAKALVFCDEEYLNCKHKFRLTSIWQSVAEEIEVTVNQKYRFMIKGLNTALKDREEVVDLFKSLVATVFNRSVHLLSSDDGKRSILMIYQGKYGRPVVPLFPADRKPSEWTNV